MRKNKARKTHTFFSPRESPLKDPLDVRHNHSITTLLHYSITHTTVYRYREEKKVAADFNRVSAVVIPKPFDF